MALALARRVGRESYVEGDLDVVWHQIEAANSIPEGAPVGTIARRPDGEWLAERKVSQSTGAGRWVYLKLGYPSTEVSLEPHDADSWPVIYDPTKGVHTGAVINAETQSQIRDALDGSTAQQEPETCRICNGSGVGYGKVPGGWLETDCAACDATREAQQEPGESLARGLDDLAAGRVSRRDDYLEPQQEPALRERFPKQASAYVADPELAEVDDEPLPSGSLITPKPRQPRVVDRLGVDEQGSRWRDVIGDVWNWDECGWHCVAEYGQTSPVPYLAGETALHGPFKEILEPRVLQSLDCEEARDGTEWKFRLNGELRSLVYRNTRWRYGEVGDPIGSRCGIPDGHNFIREFAPYTEVLGDPS